VLELIAALINAAASIFQRLPGIPALQTRISIARPHDGAGVYGDVDVYGTYKGRAPKKAILLVANPDRTAYWPYHDAPVRFYPDKTWSGQVHIDSAARHICIATYGSETARLLDYHGVVHSLTKNNGVECCVEFKELPPDLQIKADVFVQSERGA
jgi:hypothetical protein